MVLDLVEEFRQPLDGESKENVAARVLLRMNATERHRGKNHEVRSIIQMQARSAASALRGWKEYRPFAFQW